ncbi:uncharacterized protein LOC126801706 isoform X2 [Argentina anserina]|uniref:uncharacterized protein LOC126801706 isoform X2 n=1 Tax=Argentina anserina TaxID=57926 RepID=UPI00217694DB|nr:uncharacterized protein LOC126801706 isoform X2 [Potentilla anserina]
MSFCDHDNLRGPTENPMGGGQQVQRRHITDNPPYFSSAVGPEEVERHHAKANNASLIGPRNGCGSALAFWSGFVSRGFRSEGRCLICSLDEHNSSECPYQAEVPKNAIVGRGCDIICKDCPLIPVMLSERCRNHDSRRAELKYCVLCQKLGEHWPDHCPELNSGYWGPLLG